MLSDRRSQHLATPLLPMPPPHSSYSIGGHISSCKREEKNYVKILTFQNSTHLRSTGPCPRLSTQCCNIKFLTTLGDHPDTLQRCHILKEAVVAIVVIQIFLTSKRSRTSIQRCFQSEETTLATNAMIKLFLPTGKCSVSCSVRCLLIIHEIDKNHKSKHHGGWGGLHIPPLPLLIFS